MTMASQKFKTLRQRNFWLKYKLALKKSKIKMLCISKNMRNEKTNLISFRSNKYNFWKIYKNIKLQSNKLKNKF